MDKRLVGISKLLSLILRHKPETVGLSLDEEGWADLDELLRRATAHGRTMSRADVERVVAENDKKRFALSADGRRIRAVQGHSLDVDLKWEPRRPPAVLFHGTASRFLTSIYDRGLVRGSRRHVHLSADEDTATRVGSRHGKPVVLRIDTAAMVEEGFLFFRSENGVWLTEHVPARFLSPPEP